MTAKRVTTQSGAVYEFRDGKVRREGSDVKRGDSQWLELKRQPTIERFEDMILFLEPLAPQTDVTIRRTTPVMTIEEIA